MEAIPKSEFETELWRRQVIEDLTGVQLVSAYMLHDVQLELEY